MTIQRLMSPDAIAAEFGPISELRALRTGAFEVRAVLRNSESRTLWTLVDGPYGPLLTSGYHVVNRLAYWSSATPVPDEVIVDEAPDMSLVTCDTCDTAWDSDLYESPIVNTLALRALPEVMANSTRERTRLSRRVDQESISANA